MVYFILYAHLNAIKIGVSDNPKGRLSSLQTACPHPLKMLGTIEGSYEVEKELHQRFKEIRMEGEWFRDTCWLRDHITDLTTPPVKLWGKEISDVYLAGKITEDSWRDGIVNYDRHSVLNSREEWLAKRAISVPGFKRRLNYRGPFWIDLEGHGWTNPGSHGSGEDFSTDHCCEYWTVRADWVRNRCLAGINASNLVFAWIESPDCFGTIAEITFAYSLVLKSRVAMPLIVIAHPQNKYNLREDMWFIFSMAHRTIAAKTPSEAWHSLWTHGYTSCHEGTIQQNRPIEYEYEDEETEDEDGVLGPEGPESPRCCRCGEYRDDVTDGGFCPSCLVAYEKQCKELFEPCADTENPFCKQEGS